MLKHLHIVNYAIIEGLDIEFAPGLNTITGETGAGKSILLGALGLLSGVRADSSVIGQGGDTCVVEGVFVLKGYDLQRFFEEQELDFADEIEVRRTVSRSGKSRAFVGDSPVSLQTLRALSDRLIDIHSQHQTLLLGQADFQQQIVDAAASNGELLGAYVALYDKWSATCRQIAALRKASEQGAAQEEFLGFQIEQLKQSNVEVGEQERLEAEQRELVHAEEIGVALGGVAQAFNCDEGGVLASMKLSLGLLGKVSGNFERATVMSERLNSCYIELKDLVSEVEDAAMSVEVNPQRLEKIEQRLDTIYSLCKKHNVESGDDLPAILAQYTLQYSAIENGAQMVDEAEKLAAQQKGEAEILAGKLRESRQKVAPKIESYVVETLLKLGIKHAQIRVNIEPLAQIGPSGADGISLLFSANENSALQSIDSVASGGEMSRLMLSIKGLVAQKMQLPTIIFDEIDTGVSGAVADAMGEIICSMATSMQVINITHLPQVASKGDHHYEVYKNRGTHIRKLNPEERIEQIASMLSGATITESAREQAKTLLKK